ncbi:MAG: HAMP domain-containing protein [Deltaproteobacteria bacterium]|nr:HAMP domain-containing protein [Deltaproteobacteria bacterium]
MLFAFYVAKSERSNALARTQRDAFHLMSLASREHAHQIRGARELLLWLGKKLASEGRESPIIADPDLLKALLAGHPQLANIGVLSANGEVLQSAYPMASDQSWQNNPAYGAAMYSEDVVVGTYLISPIFGRPTLNHAYAVRDVKGKIFAVLFTGLNLNWLSEIETEHILPDGFSLIVTDRRGQVVAYGSQTNLPPVNVHDMSIPNIAGLAASHGGQMIEIQPGIRRYFMAAALAGAPGVYVAVSLPYDRVVNQINTIFYRTLMGLSFLTLFTIIAVFLAAEFGILRGLRSLTRAVERLGEGDLSVRVKTPRGQNEFTTLARTFNELADSLAAQHSETMKAQTRLRALSHRLQMTREAEAARISRELHDEIGQTLTALKIDLTRLQLCCESHAEMPPCAVALKTGVQAMTEQINNSIDFVRKISSRLRPSVLDKMGLNAAIEWQAREIEKRTALVVQVDLESIDLAEAEFVSITLFRILQEALTNVVRHADASIVEVSLTQTEKEVCLRIKDDGRGVAPKMLKSAKSLGIEGMRERALLIGGHLSIESAAEQGTILSVTVPNESIQEAKDAHPIG